MSNSFSVIVFISGTGSNLEAILQQQDSYKVVLVVSNNGHAQGLEFAKQRNIPTYTFKWDKNDHKILHLQDKINQYDADLIALAGFMRILPAAFIQAFTNKIINIHPSLLPKYPGLNTHQRVLNNQDIQHGATVHYVNEQLDAGKIISQTQIQVAKNTTADELASKLLFREHSLYPYTIDLIAKNRVEWLNDILHFDGEILTNPIIFND